ncbi:deoxyuridine 5'-triphosphate nucleotidohydrolase [Seinonella peptonophila]|uniref:Deoxyuridine 5'-triphosphate nucleotidohydrolase n=1 Tax=Seinonella peptonophila TaxID=112248 RepID=A0A1M4VDY2_9BACL|nr:dUTP diphosphatase [Seinonella peptonophila]SHE67112.1 deoxyuridine 5'-triphosphate nucleotidohydrolase [Seinonella peptonophila]
MKIKVRKLHPNAQLPARQTIGSAGFDLSAAIDELMVIKPGETRLVPTGLAFEITGGYEIQIRPRSGLALKNQVTVLNSPGTIDCDFRGEVGVILTNLGKSSFIIHPGDRIAQIVVQKLPEVEFIEVAKIENTVRGDGAFGSTGV